MKHWSFPADRALDALCLGRAGVDLYAVQENTALEDVQTFRKSVGGSPANIATAIARLGGKAGVIGVISNDGLGRYVRAFLRANGVSDAGLKTVSGRSLNSLALTEVRPQDCQVVIYRQDAADLQITAADIDATLIASSASLLITGTALSASPSREACFYALELARRANTTAILDLDYRPYGWESAAQASAILMRACELADIVIGNRDEFDVLEYSSSGSDRNDAQSAQRVLRGNTKVAVVKDGAQGCKIFFADGEYLSQGIFPVAARKPFGAGDAFAGTLIWALRSGQSWSEAARLGAAAAAINVSRDACADAMATQNELLAFVAGHPQFLSTNEPSLKVTL